MHLLLLVTGPVARFARQIAGQGYICAAPSSYHEFTGPEPLQYNAEDTDKGNAWKIGKVRTCTSPGNIGFGQMRGSILFYFYFWLSVIFGALAWRGLTWIEIGCLRRGRESLRRLSALAADVQWPGRRHGHVPRWPPCLPVCSR